MHGVARGCTGTQRDAGVRIDEDAAVTHEDAGARTGLQGLARGRGQLHKDARGCTRMHKDAWRCIGMQEDVYR